MPWALLCGRRRRAPGTLGSGVALLWEQLELRISLAPGAARPVPPRVPQAPPGGKPTSQVGAAHRQQPWPHLLVRRRLNTTGSAPGSAGGQEARADGEATPDSTEPGGLVPSLQLLPGRRVRAHPPGKPPDPRKSRRYQARPVPGSAHVHTDGHCPQVLKSGSFLTTLILPFTRMKCFCIYFLLFYNVY